MRQLLKPTTRACPTRNKYENVLRRIISGLSYSVLFQMVGRGKETTVVMLATLAMLAMLAMLPSGRQSDGW